MKLGILGGSGLYEIEGLKHQKWEEVSSPFGTPSDSFMVGKLNGVDIAFLPRHGRGHVHSPTSIPYRANIDAFKRLGVTHLLSLSAVGSLDVDIEPGDFVIVDQFIDRTVAREKSFFGEGCVAHVSMAHPTCPDLSTFCYTAAIELDIKTHEQGTYLAMEGPQFSTLAESLLYKQQFKCDVVGMTNMPEAKLAREAEICYCSVAMVTDFDCWHPDHSAVEVSDIIRTMSVNTINAKNLISELTKKIHQLSKCSNGCSTCLDNAIITAVEKIDPKIKEKLFTITARVWA